MEIIIYLLVVCLIIYIVFSLLPIILPVILIIILLASIYIWYMKRKIVKHMDEMEQDMDTMFQEDRTIHPSEDDVIDVEYTERQDDSGQ